MHIVKKMEYNCTVLIIAKKQIIEKWI